MAHQSKMFVKENGKRVIVMDNFYTRHTLATILKKLSDNDISVIGTVRMNNVDGVNMEKNSKKQLHY